MEAIVFTTVLTLASYLLLASAAGPSVIVVGAGFSGISAAKTLSDAGITNIVILEATNRIGGRICKVPFAGINVEKGANWVEGVNGNHINPIWTFSNQLGLRKFRSDYNNLSSNTYKEKGGLYGPAEIQSVIDTADEVYDAGEKYSGSLPNSGLGDISILASQRLQNHMPSSAAEMVVDYYNFDYEFAEPPRVTSLQNTVPLATFANFGEDVYFVADQRGYETVVHNVAKQFLKTSKDGTILDPRLILNKVVRVIEHSPRGVTVKTEDGAVYKAGYVIVSVSLGVLQSKLIQFVPKLPTYLLNYHRWNGRSLQFMNLTWPFTQKSSSNFPIHFGPPAMEHSSFYMQVKDVDITLFGSISRQSILEHMFYS